MCGRYYIPEGNEFSDINSLLDFVNKAYKGSSALSKMKTGEVFPADIAPIITQEAPKLMKWGFAGFNGKSLIINARLETVAEKPMFKREFSAQRCLIPAGNYFEWKKVGLEKEKYAIRQSGPLYMAGLWQLSESESVPLFVILTRPAIPEIGFIHDRMPVILPKNVHDDWLSGRLGSRELRELESGQLYFESVG